MEIDSGEYQLSCELRGHEDDVRGICICGDGGFATSSRDKTVRFWTVNPQDKHKYELSKIMLGHTSFVGPLAWISPNDSFPEGGLVSGGMDTLVIVWDLKTGESVNTIKGHQLQVTGLLVDDNSDIVSTSVDCTIRRWRNGQQVELWEPHKMAVQAVLKLPSNEIITGSSDTTLKLWRGKTCVHTFVGHTDTVRGLAQMPDLGVLSASHDGSVRLWALTGEVLMEMVGHTSIVYSVHAHVSGLIVSGSEDCCLKIWKDGVCVQSIEHPGCVWDAKFLENGDIVTACSDGVVRIWTMQSDGVADPAIIESYASLVSHYKCSRKRVGGLKLEELPGMEALHTPGTTDGQTKIVREGDNGVAYAWNSAEQRWDKIGEVVDGPEDNMSGPVLDGVQYDYVFDVDIGDGEPTRKLPYNRSDNPYNVADKWLLKENLPLTYREQVVEFILQNSGQKNFSVDTSFRDPYTGSNAYVPGEPSRASGAPVTPVFKHIPKKGMLFFDAAQFDGILKKITEFNGALLSDQKQKDLSLSEIELSRMEAVIKILKDTSHYHSSTFADVDIALLLKLLVSWPVTMLFPVIDVLRMVILHPSGASLLVNHFKDGNDVIMETIKKVTTAPALAANLLTTIRAMTNLFKHSCFHQWLHMHRTEILDSFSSCPASNKNVQVSYSTLLLKMSGYHGVAPPRVQIPEFSGISSINLESPPSQSSPGASNKKEQRRWSSQMDEVLVASLILDMEKRGRRVGKGFLSATLKAVAVAVSEECKTIVTSDNVRSRFKTLKKDYIKIKAALEASGFGITWDEGAKYITADPGAWDDYVKAHPEAKGLRHKFFPHYDSLAIICGVDNATGDGMFSGQDPEALQGTRGGTPLEGDEGENDVEHLDSVPPTDGVPINEDSPDTPMPSPSDSGHQGKTPTLSRRRKRIDDSPELLSMNEISNSIASIADSLKGPNLGEMVSDMKHIPNMSRTMLMRGTALFADKPALVKMYQAMEEDMKLEWLEMMLEKHDY